MDQDYKEAARWYKLAADQGHAEAQFNLALMYTNGQGVEQNDQEAFRLFRLAAEQGQREAASNLGALYVNGVGVSKDYVEAVKWLSVAVSEGDRDSVDPLDQVVARMTQPQLEKAGQMAKAWKPCQSKAECDARVKQ